MGGVRRAYVSASVGAEIVVGRPAPHHVGEAAEFAISGIRGHIDGLSVLCDFGGILVGLEAGYPGVFPDSSDNTTTFL